MQINLHDLTQNDPHIPKLKDPTIIMQSNGYYMLWYEFQ